MADIARVIFRWLVVSACVHTATTLMTSVHRLGDEHQKPLLFIGVFTAPCYVQRREEVRQSWMNHRFVDNVGAKSLVKARFVVGVPESEDERVALQAEMKLHDDMIQLPDHMESYHNLPNKTIAFFHWFVNNSESERAAFAMKLDDDTFPNLDRLVPLLQEKEKVSPHTYIGSLLWHGAVQSSGKWAESGHYHEREYPAYMAGSGYILSSELARHLDEVNLKEGRLKVLSNEDTTIGVFVHQENFMSLVTEYVNVWSNVWGCSDQSYLAMNLFPGEMTCMWKKMTAGGGFQTKDMCCRPLEKYGLWDPANPTDQNGKSTI